MASWIKRQKIGNKTYTTNMKTGGVRITTTTKRNKNSSGPTISLSNSTKGKSYRTESYKSGNMTKRSRTTLFKTPKAKTVKVPKSKKTPTSTSRTRVIRPSTWFTMFVSLAVIVAMLLLVKA